MRKGKIKGLDLKSALSMFFETYEFFSHKHYFDEAFGYDCVDAGWVAGELGYKIESFFQRKLRKSDLWPIHKRYREYSEDDMFDVIELLYDLASKPVDGSYHSYNQCGMHYETFDAISGREEWRSEINSFLKDFSDGYVLDEHGEILSVAPGGLSELLTAELPEIDSENVNSRVQAAITKFRRHRSTIDDRRDAIRDLADVLEFLRPNIKLVLQSSDESELFNIANNFGIRHHNQNQKTKYDPAIWLSWMFYHFLATIHASTRLIERIKARD